MTQVNKLKERKSIADSLWQECTELARLNRFSEAVKKCEQSIGYLNREDRQRALVELKAAERKAREEAERKAQADRLWNECIELAKANRFNEAVKKCEESLKYYSREDRIKALSDLRRQSEGAKEEVQNKQIADRLWNECIELARKKQYEKAWQKCDESLKYWRNDQRVEVTAKLREEAISKIIINTSFRASKKRLHCSENSNNRRPKQTDC